MQYTMGYKWTFGFLILFFSGAISHLSLAQFQLPQARLSDDRSSEFAIIHATLVLEPGKISTNSTLYIKGGQIVSAGTNVVLPAGIEIRDVKGAWVYASFLDVFSSYGQPSANQVKPATDGVPQYESKRNGAFSLNQALKPEFDAATVFQPN